MQWGPASNQRYHPPVGIYKHACIRISSPASTFGCEAMASFSQGNQPRQNLKQPVCTSVLSNLAQRKILMGYIAVGSHVLSTFLWARLGVFHDRFTAAFACECVCPQVFLIRKLSRLYIEVETKSVQRASDVLHAVIQSLPFHCKCFSTFCMHEGSSLDISGRQFFGSRVSNSPNKRDCNMQIHAK